MTWLPFARTINRQSYTALTGRASIPCSRDILSHWSVYLVARFPCSPIQIYVLYDLVTFCKDNIDSLTLCSDREGVNSLFPEMILLPRWFPLHTSRMWSYCRTVYMPMSYLYGKRYQGPVTDVVKELREGVHARPVGAGGDW